MLHGFAFVGSPRLRRAQIERADRADPPVLKCVNCGRLVVTSLPYVASSSYRSLSFPPNCLR